MTDRSIEDLMDALDFLLDDFDQICRSAVATYRGYPPEILVEHDPRAAASCTYAHMVAEAERRLSRHQEVAPLDPYRLGGLKVWRVGDFAVIRFKKHDEDGKSRNYRTKQAQDYDRGNPLPGLPAPAARLSVGYLLDATGTEFIRSQVARPTTRSIEWCAAVVPTEEWREGERRWVNVTRQGRF